MTFAAEIKFAVTARLKHGVYSVNTYQMLVFYYLRHVDSNFFIHFCIILILFRVVYIVYRCYNTHMIA